MVKQYTRRDSAVAILRKMGVAKTDYNKFIKLDGDVYLVDLDAARRSTVKVVKQAVKRSTKPKTGQPKRVTVASRARELINEGLENAEVFEVLQKEHGLSDDKKWYPAWYRFDMRRKGQLA